MNVKKIYPSAEQLKTVSRLVKCTEKDCSKIFSSESNLMLHLAKTHKKESILSPKGDREFHCPESKCIYHNDKFFKTLKQVKQHYHKVHITKDIVCESCRKGFSTDSQHLNHLQYCGIIFNCTECEMQYPSYESLITHARRKCHKILEKTTFAKSQEQLVMKTEKDLPNRTQIIKQSSICQLIILPIQISGNLKEKNAEKATISTQTDFDLQKLKVKKSQIGKFLVNTKRYSQETQTLARKKPKLTVETQTVGEYSKKKANANDVFTNNSSDFSARKSIKTQTNVVVSKSISCNTSFSFNDMDFTLTNDLQRNTSSTQTYSELSGRCNPITTNDSITDTNEIMDLNSTFDSNFFSCNIETQTDIKFDEDLFNCDYYSDTHTQTCEDMLLGDIGFSDIETQTAIEDVLRSVESQTLMSHTMKNSSNSRDVSNIETQTDIEFKKMLEEINS